MAAPINCLHNFDMKSGEITLAAFVLMFSSHGTSGWDCATNDVGCERRGLNLWGTLVRAEGKWSWIGWKPE